jgi:hypothetical protein
MRCKISLPLLSMTSESPNFNVHLIVKNLSKMALLGKGHIAEMQMRKMMRKYSSCLLGQTCQEEDESSQYITSYV